MFYELIILFITFFYSKFTELNQIKKALNVSVEI